MDNLLFLLHRIPYPPNKGDKIRSYNLLKYLSQRYRVYLGAFIDNPHDVRYQADLEKLCHEVHTELINPRWRKVVSAKGLMRREALSLAYYRHPGMDAWVRNKLSSGAMKHVLIFSSPMAQYVLGKEGHSTIRSRIADFVDVDSVKWAQYSENQGLLMRALYRRESKKLLRFERHVAADFDATVFVSQAEKNLFQQMAPEVSHKVMHVPNGVDTAFFSPERNYSNPYAQDDMAIVFTGAMDYWANVDAAKWFAHEALPGIRSRIPQARFYVVGARPTEQVQRLNRLDGVKVIGAVRDIRPYLLYAQFAVAPVRIARGIQNKVLEAMAMAKPVLATSSAMEGLDVPEQFSELICNDAQTFITRAVRMLTAGDEHRLGPRGRELTVRAYAWKHRLSGFGHLLECNDKAGVGTALRSEGEPQQYDQHWSTIGV